MALEHQNGPPGLGDPGWFRQRGWLVLVMALAAGVALGIGYALGQFWLSP